MKSLKNISSMVAIFMVLLFAIAFYGTPAFGQAEICFKI